ncbi:MAG: agmatine deiminase family protein [Planctomycetota bacterium]
MRAWRGILPVICLTGLAGDLAAQDARWTGGPAGGMVTEDEQGQPIVLPRYREGGTPYNPAQKLTPYAIEVDQQIPSAGLIESPPEYGPTRGVLYHYTSSQWASVVRDLVVALTASPAHDEIAWVVVPDATQQQNATNAFVAGGADMTKVRFIIQPANALWIRDYGPHFIWQNGALAIVDSHYYPSRPLDNFRPTLLGDDYFIMPTYDMGLYYSGGNFQPGPNRSAFVTALVNGDNPASAGFTPALIAELYARFQGIDTLHVMPQLPSSVDGTGHIDMWMYLIDEHNVIISKFKTGSDPTAIQITENAVPYMQALGFNVYRTWAWNTGSTHWTYTNAFRVNDRIFMPTYSGYPTESADALAQFQAAAGPNVQIVPIECTSIIPAAGAVHCIVMQVPRYTASVPAVDVISPDGGELLVAGSTATIQWVATDTNNVEIPRIDLYYTVDNGQSYEFIATTTDTGFYDWQVPNISAAQVKVRVVAISADLDQGEGLSDGFFRIARAYRSVYDFRTGGGVDKFGFGHDTASWSNVSGVRLPVTAPITNFEPTAYARLAYSDATSTSTSDPNRYNSQWPTASTNESTHVYEFTIAENPAIIDDLGIVWEGFASRCTQVELYVWDRVAQQWSDGAGLLDQNRYMDSWAGNRDGHLRGNVRANFSRYIDANGKLTLLVYAERQYDPTYHDYIGVTVTVIGEALTGDLNCDGLVDFGDINPFVLALTNPAAWQAAFPGCPVLNGDVNLDGVVNFGDINPFVRLLTNP